MSHKGPAMMNSGSDKNVLLCLQKKVCYASYGIDWEPLETRTTYDWECDCEREGIFGPRAQVGFIFFLSLKSWDFSIAL